MHGDKEARFLKRWPWPDFAPGEEVAGFTIERRLAAGSFGTVYRARRGGQVLAIKLVLFQPRGERELDALRRVHHPNVVGFHGYGQWPHEQPRFLVLALDLVRGASLEEWARAVNPTARELVRQVMLPLSASLREVHAAGVVHRDVKETNIVMREADETPVLVDFGAAIYTGAPRLTDYMPPGTAEYRSPEIMRFARTWDGSRYPATPADDLWALGVTLYGLLTRELPFGDRHGPLTDSILQTPPVPPHERNPRVPGALGALCLRMLEKDPGARYAHAQALVEALEALEVQADDAWDVPLFEGARGRPPPASEPEPEAAAPPPEVPVRPAEPTSRPGTTAWVPWVAVLAVVMSLFFLPEAPRRGGAEEAPAHPRSTSPSGSPSQGAGTRQELASPSQTGEVGSGTELGKSSPPAPDTPSKNSEEHAMKPQKSGPQVRSLVAAGAVCMTAACAGGPQSRPPPRPAECPPGAAETHQRYGLTRVFGNLHDLDKVVKEGEATVGLQFADYGKLIDPNNAARGHFYIRRGRLYGRFTEARINGGPPVPICGQITFTDGLGAPLNESSTPERILMTYGFFVAFVDHFD